MKKLLLISALLFSFNGFTEPSSATQSLLWDKSLPYMTFALFTCELQGSTEDNVEDISYKKIEFGGCNYNFARDKLIIYFTKYPPDKEANQTQMDLCKDAVPRHFNWAWKAEEIKKDFIGFMGVPHLEYFYEKGMMEAGRGEKLTKWLTDHVEVYTFIGYKNLLSSEGQKDGISCMYRMGRDSYTTYRIESYSSFLIGRHDS